jgi:hypothetical protein
VVSRIVYVGVGDLHGVQEFGELRYIAWIVKGDSNQSLQQFLSIPVYTIFKNLTIILIVRFFVPSYLPSPYAL